MTIEPLRNRPEWIPVQAWAEIEKWQRHPGSENVQTVVSKILACKECGCVWRAIERRIAALQSKVGPRPRERLCPVFVRPEEIDYLLRLSKRPVLGDAPYRTVLVAAVTYSLWRDEAVMFPASERRRLTAPIKRHARLLWESLSSAERIGEATTPLFREITKCLEQRGVIDGRTRAPILQCLDAIVEGATTWGASSPLVGQPKAGNAERLYFVRRMTEAFRAWFGPEHPMREQVAALTRCIFDCELDAATVRKLAP